MMPLITVSASGNRPVKENGINLHDEGWTKNDSSNFEIWLSCWTGFISVSALLIGAHSRFLEPLPCFIDCGYHHIKIKRNLKKLVYCGLGWSIWFTFFCLKKKKKLGKNLKSKPCFVSPNLTIKLASVRPSLTHNSPLLSNVSLSRLNMCGCQTFGSCYSFIHIDCAHQPFIKLLLSASYAEEAITVCMFNTLQYCVFNQLARSSPSCPATDDKPGPGNTTDIRSVTALLCKTDAHTLTKHLSWQRCWWP